MNKKTKNVVILISTIIIVFSFIYSLNVAPSVFGRGNSNRVANFSSYEEFIVFLRENHVTKEEYNGYNHWRSLPFALESSQSVSDGKMASDSQELNDVDYSETNIQVEGVDEPDIIKTDGTYIYLVANSKIYIIKVYPEEDASVMSVIELDDMYVNSLFLNDDKLIAFGGPGNIYICYEYGYYNHKSSIKINIYDISDRANPELNTDVEIDGFYVDSRMIDDTLYFVTYENLYNLYRNDDGNETISIPEIVINDCAKKIPAHDINYIDCPGELDTISYIISINLEDNKVNQESYMFGSSQEMYMSQNSIYLVYTDYEYLDSNPFTGGYRERKQKTIIHKISVKDGEINYIAKGEVPGRILNQFSMDENKGYFRIATTVGNVWDGEQKSSNNVYILDEDLKRVSEIEDIAPGERIYSARFMGDRAYLVTFKKVDPFFTLDLSDPKDPKILGKLKIPGYSDYLHPFDENHVIGIGKDTVEALSNEKERRNLDFAWYQGIKIALFDVSDFDNPKVLSQVIIGDRGTSSPALHNHKAFLFDKEKELLVIPISLYEIDEEIKKQNDGYTGSSYGDFTFQGAYVYKLNLDGFDFLGRITHMDDEDFSKSSYYYGFSGSKNVKRSLFIEDMLYTISDSMVKINDLGENLSEVNSLDLE